MMFRKIGANLAHHDDGWSRPQHHKRQFVPIELLMAVVDAFGHGKSWCAVGVCTRRRVFAMQPRNNRIPPKFRVLKREPQNEKSKPMSCRDCLRCNHTRDRPIMGRGNVQRLWPADAARYCKRGRFQRSADRWTQRSAASEQPPCRPALGRLQLLGPRGRLNTF